MIRQAHSSDLPVIRRLFRDTILAVNRKDYSESQVARWAAHWQHEERWNERFANDYFVVAERHGFITGFAVLESTGHFKFLFVHKDYQRQGIATALCAAIESRARELGLARLESNVSITARPFMGKNGYVVTAKQETDYPEGAYVNYKMEKHLSVRDALNSRVPS